jgi:alkaline phosphatase D
MFAPQVAAGQRSTAVDSWDGYRASRERVFDLVEQLKAGNLAVLTGDVHSSWAYDLPRRPFDGYDKAAGKGSLGVEFAGTSISSPSGLDSGTPEGQKRLAAVRVRPHLHYVEGRYRGYFTLDLSRDRLQADFFSVPTVQERTTTEQFEKGFMSESGRNHLIEVSKPAGEGRTADPAPK